MAHIVLVTTTGLLLIAIVFLIVRWILRRRYTRERFAYAIVSVATSMVVVAVATFPAQEMPWEAVIRFLPNREVWNINQSLPVWLTTFYFSRS